MADERKNNVMDNFLKVLGEVIAYFTIILYAILIINANFHFISNGLLYYLRILQIYAPIGLITVLGLRFSSKRHIAFRILFYIIIAVIIVFSFFPDTWTNFVAAL